MESLGEYVDLSREKLKMAVWSGEIALRDLSLKSTAFASLDLPVHVLKGSLGRLKVTIPWTNLGNSSTVVQLDDIIALIGPSDDRSFTAEDLQRHSSELKRKILEKAAKIAYAYISTELNKKELDRADFNEKKKAKRSSWMTSIGVSYIQGIIAKVMMT
jgi:vacuolar protein sorting-associated protein 13A/C